MTTVVPNDVAAMVRALLLAERGRATCRPNPLVGCVLVRDGAVVGEGWHARAGGPHAEVVALAAAGGAARGATAYVTLEPCDHRGRTPACSRALIDAGVGRVVAAVADPHPVAGGGHDRLRGAGIPVEVGLLGAWARVQNEVFLHAVEVGRPFVTLKLAQTATGQLGKPGQRWVTGRAARTAVHAQRALADVVLVGSGTVLADDPALDVRHVTSPGPQPRPAVLDARGRIPPTAQVVRRGGLVYTTASAPRPWLTRLGDAGATLVTVPAAARGGVDLLAVLGDLHGRGVRAVYAEGGGTVARALVDARLVDRLVVHVAAPPAAASAAGRDRDRGIRIVPVVRPRGRSGWRWKAERAGPVGADLEVTAVPEEI